MTENTKRVVEGLNKHGLLYAAVFFCFLALYAVTAQRGLSWQDSGEFQCRILAGDYHWNSGIARAHPLYILMAQVFVALFPKAACFYAMNLFSGLGLALALGLLAYNVMKLTRSVQAAVMAVTVLGFAHMAWWLGTIAEVYTWSLAFLMAEVLCLIRYSEKRDSRWLIALFGVNGAHFGIHNAALLNLPVYAFLLASEVSRSKWSGWVTVSGCALFWLSGSSMIIWQAAYLLKESSAPAVVLKSVLFGDGYEAQVLGVGGFTWKCWSANIALAGLSFLNPCWLFAGRGFFQRQEQGQREVRSWLRALTVLQGAFWVRYFVPDQATFVLPTLGLLAVWVGLGVGKSELGVQSITTTRVARWLAIGIACAWGVPPLACAIAERAGVAVTRSRALPFRDEMRYWVTPWKQCETSAAHFVAESGKQLCAGDVLMADSTAAGPLLAAREAGVLTSEWRLITPWSKVTDADVLNLIRDGNVRFYVVSPVEGYVKKAFLEAAGRVERAGVLYRTNGSRQPAIGHGSEQTGSPAK